MLLIDEINMVSSKQMNSINKQCKLTKGLNSNSTTVFVGLPVVIVLGDFHKFSLVRARTSWQKQKRNNKEIGQQVWYMFDIVVGLDEQMRQQQDAECYQKRHGRPDRCEPTKYQDFNTARTASR
jgi:hypothetical protein